MPVTTTSTLAPQVVAAFHDRLLSTPTPNLIHSIPAERMTMPANKGDKLIFSRYNRLPAALVKLGNTGVTPPSVPLTALNIEVEYSTYGQWVEINELVTLQRNDRVLNAAVKQLGEGLMRTEDELVRNMLTATASFINCTAGVNGRIVAVLKSFLMGLKLLTGNAEDNKAEAGFMPGTVNAVSGKTLVMSEAIL